MIVLSWNMTWRTRHVTRPGVAVAIIGMLLVTALMCWSTATGAAAAAADLYRTQAVITGQGEANRVVGFAGCLEDVLIKVSGALQLAGDPRLALYKSRAGDFVSAYSYHDQMSGTPVRDEQGTRDRPYDLIVDFDEKKIDALLGAIDLKPWLSHRPVLAVFVAMEQGARRYIVTSDAKQSDLQRESLLAAAAKRGMTIVLPDTATLTTANIDGADLMTTPPATLASRAAEQGADVALVGRLVWVDSELGWATEWQMNWQTRPHRWQARGINFDEAFRRGIGGAAQLLSDNGDPAEPGTVSRQAR
ncbi:MAG: hypothetical protein JWP25_2417 [Bradyrhizobium sp.]|nr:hypothetical protein [Bradyrhizobium sp.]